MGFFKKLFRLIKPVIECPDKFRDELIYVAPLKRGKINLNATLIVREGFVAIVLIKEKSTDMFTEGKHKITTGTLPLTSKKVNFSPKVSKKTGKVVKTRTSFRGEIIFINLSVMEENFKGIEAFHIKDNSLGKAKVRINGWFSYNIENARVFIDLCLLEWAYIKSDIVRKRVRQWVSAEVIKHLIKINPSLIEFAKNNEFLSERISPELSKKFNKYGFNVTGFKITETFVPNKMLDRLQELDLESGESRLENDIYRDSAYLREYDTEPQYEARQEEVLNDYFKESFDSGFVAPAEKVNSVEFEPMGNTEVLVETINDRELKNCNNCSAIIDKYASACYNCGAKQSSKKLCNSCSAEMDEGEFVCPNCRSIIIG